MKHIFVVRDNVLVDNLRSQVTKEILDKLIDKYNFSDSYITLELDTKELSLKILTFEESPDQQAYGMKLWKSFGNAYIDDEGYLLCDWHTFDRGTNREDIWKWFEYEFGFSVAELINESK